MIRTIMLSAFIAAFSLSLDAGAEDASTLSRNALTQNDRQYTDGPVTQLDSIGVEYGHLEEYVHWLNSTWKPTMEAMKRAGLIVDYKVFQATPRSPDQLTFISRSLTETLRRRSIMASSWNTWPEM